MVTQALGFKSAITTTLRKTKPATPNKKLLRNSGNIPTKILSDMILPTQQPPKDAIREAKTIISDFGKLQTRINRYFEKWTSKGYDEKTIGGWVKPLMRESGYGRNTITRVLPEAAKFKPRGKPVSTKMVQNVIAAEEKQPEINKQQQLQQLEEKEEQLDTQPQPVGGIAQNFEQVELVEITPTTTEAVKQTESETNNNKIDWDNNNDIWLVSYNVDSYTEQECRRLLKESLNQLLRKQGEISRLNSSLKEDRESHARWYKETRGLKKKYNICELCDKKAVKEKYCGMQYCDKHLKQNIEMNQMLSPIINKVMSPVDRSSESTKSN